MCTFYFLVVMLLTKLIYMSEIIYLYGKFLYTHVGGVCLVNVSNMSLMYNDFPVPSRVLLVNGFGFLCLMSSINSMT